MISEIKMWIARRKIYKQTLKELNSLTRHELIDLGLDPYCIEEVAKEAAYGKDYNRV